MESILGYMERYDYENLFICQDRTVGLRAVIALHDTTLGPATGGTRMWTYDSEMDAIEDALRAGRVRQRLARRTDGQRAGIGRRWIGTRPLVGCRGRGRRRHRHRLGEGARGRPAGRAGGAAGGGHAYDGGHLLPLR